MDQSKGKHQRDYQQGDQSSQKKGYGKTGAQKVPNPGTGKKSMYPNKMPTGKLEGLKQGYSTPGMGGSLPGTMPYYGGASQQPSSPQGYSSQPYAQMAPSGGSPSVPTPSYGMQMPGLGTPSMSPPGTSMPSMPMPGMQPSPSLPYQTPVQGATPMFPGGAFGRERSYIENILRLNRGKQVTAYFTFENNEQWNSRTFTGILQEAGKDHIVIADPQTGKWYLLLMIYLDYVEFDEEIEYEYPFA